VDGLDVSIILNGWIKSNPLTFFFCLVDGLDGYYGGWIGWIWI